MIAKCSVDACRQARRTGYMIKEYRLARYHLSLPPVEPHKLDQDEAYFFLKGEGEQTRIRFHDYAAIYRRPGLYEQLFYDRLKCSSPKKVAELLSGVVSQNLGTHTGLRVLDVGAGNGMAGEELIKRGVARLVGIDIIPEARAACDRDRPGLYDAYYVQDLLDVDPDAAEDLRAWRLDCLVCVAALGFGDIPPRAFFNALDFIADDGWLAFNIKDTFLSDSDPSGFSMFIKKLMLDGHIDVHHMERYRHRVSIDGSPLYYFAIVGRKRGKIPESALKQ